MSAARSEELESAIMGLLWSYGHPVHIGTVFEDLESDHAATLGSVVGAMTRLRRERYVRRTQRGPAYLYEPRELKDAFTRRLVRGVLTPGERRGLAFVHASPPPN